MSIDWDTFAARVPTGTRVRAYKVRGEYLTDGFLMENQPYREWEWGSGDAFLRMADFRKPKKTCVHALSAEYRIGTGRKKWLTFDEVMK